MATFVTETPSGVINGVNTSFTTSQAVDSLISTTLDGLPYFGASVLGTALTLADAPTNNLTVVYLAASSGPILPSSNITVGEARQQLNRAMDDTLPDVSDTLFLDWLNYINEEMYWEYAGQNPCDFTLTTIIAVNGTLAIHNLPTDFDTSNVGVYSGFHILDSNGERRERLTQLRSNKQVQGYRIIGNTVQIRAQKSGNIELEYLPLLGELTQDSDVTVIDQRFKRLLKNAMKVALGEWEEDAALETNSDARFARSLDMFKERVPKQPKVFVR